MKVSSASNVASWHTVTAIGCVVTPAPNVRVPEVRDEVGRTRAVAPAVAVPAAVAKANSGGSGRFARVTVKVNVVVPAPVPSAAATSLIDNLLGVASMSG